MSTQIKRSVLNTTEQVNRNPIEFLAESWAGGTSNAIERQESCGQQSFVNSDTLPMQVGDARQALKRMGVKFIGPVEGDELFQYVELPKGWKKVPTEHSMWSKLVDEKGRSRAAIFYKAAFYDRAAHLGLERSHQIVFTKTGEKWDEGVTTVMHNGKELYRAKSQKYGAGSDECAAWLTANRPQWENPEAYWD